MGFSFSISPWLLLQQCHHLPVTQTLAWMVDCAKLRMTPTPVNVPEGSSADTVRKVLLRSWWRGRSDIITLWHCWNLVFGKKHYGRNSFYDRVFTQIPEQHSETADIMMSLPMQHQQGMAKAFIFLQVNPPTGQLISSRKSGPGGKIPHLQRQPYP